MEEKINIDNEKLDKLKRFADENKYKKSVYWDYLQEIRILLSFKTPITKINKYLIQEYENYNLTARNLNSFINRNLTAERYIVKKKVVNKKLDANNKKVVKEASVDSLSKENSETQKTIARMMEVVRARNS